MNKKIIGTSLAIMLGIASFGAADAFWGQNNSQNNMNADRFQEMQTRFASATSFEDFMKIRGEMRAERQISGQNIRSKMTRNVENISNGIVMTITSDDATAIERIQSRERRNPQNETTKKVVEKIENGVKITITSDDPDYVEIIQSRSGERMNRQYYKNSGQGQRMGRGQGMGRGRFMTQ